MKWMCRAPEKNIHDTGLPLENGDREDFFAYISYLDRGQINDSSKYELTYRGDLKSTFITRAIGTRHMELLRAIGAAYHSATFFFA
jgi:hypothetical protein